MKNTDKKFAINYLSKLHNLNLRTYMLQVPQKNSISEHCCKQILNFGYKEEWLI